MPKKYCKKCKILVDEDKCPQCGDNDLSTNTQGRLVVIDANKSIVAKKLDRKTKGEYAIRLK